MSITSGTLRQEEGGILRCRSHLHGIPSLWCGVWSRATKFFDLARKPRVGRGGETRTAAAVVSDELAEGSTARSDTSSPVDRPILSALATSKRSCDP